MHQRSTVQVIDGRARRGEALPYYEEEDRQPAPLARRQTFVPPAPVAQPLPAQPAPLDGFTVPSPATSNVELRTTYEDRSKGFVWAIAPVAVITGVLAMVAGTVLFAVPILSWTLLQVFLAVFCLTWIIGYALHLFVSPDGVLFLSTWLLWRTVRAEQKDRHARYWTQYEDARRDSGRQ